MEAFMFANHPVEAAGLFKNMIVFGVVWGGVMATFTAYQLAQTWPDDILASFSQEPLKTAFRLYHIIRFLFFVTQLPLRFKLLSIFNATSAIRDRAALARHLTGLLNTPVWAVNILFARFVLAIFLFGLGMTLGCFTWREAAGPLYATTWITQASFLFQMAVSYLSMRRVIARVEGVELARDHALVPGVTGDDLRQYTRLREFGQLDDALRAKVALDGCAICYEDYETTHQLRQLPCGHMYHRTCIDEWLRRKRVCPACQQRIDQPVVKAVVSPLPSPRASPGSGSSSAAGSAVAAGSVASAASGPVAAAADSHDCGDSDGASASSDDVEGVRSSAPVRPRPHRSAERAPSAVFNPVAFVRAGPAAAAAAWAVASGAGGAAPAGPSPLEAAVAARRNAS